MTQTDILYEKADGVGLITLNRPQRLNAISPSMLKDMDLILDDVMADDKVKAIIFTGAPRSDGRPCFCAGADIGETTGPEINAFVAAGNALFNRIEDLEKPTIGAVDGICTAGGLELALVLDILVAADSAQFSDMHLKNLGRMGGWGVETRLCRAVGAARAKEILWTGIPFDGNEACRIGLVNKVIPHDRLLEETKALALVIAGMRAQALTWSKRSLNAAVNTPTHEALHDNQFCAGKAVEGMSLSEVPFFNRQRGK